MPAEWDRHDATWIAWPHQAGDWPGKFSTVAWTYAEIVRHLAEGERVEVLTQDRDHQRQARRVLARSHVRVEGVRFHICPTDRSWTRDSGPTFVRKSGGPGRSSPAVALVQWKFNAWAKYPNWQRDRRVPAWIARRLGLPLFRAMRDRRWVVCEGGAIEVNGQGLLLATEECLLGDVQARNPGLDRRGLERVFGDFLGVDEVVWLARGIAGDDTHGHVDDLARFVGVRQVLAVVPDNESDVDFPVLRENREVLESFRTRSGARLTVRPLPAPRPVYFSGQRLPASYANFYIANGKVLVPTFDDPHDAEALDVIGQTFPRREVIGIRCRDLVWGLGTLHCLTQQQPGLGPRDDHLP